MNDAEVRSMTADYLGGELSPAERERYELALASDPALAAEVRSLQDTLAALRSLAPPAAAAAGAGTPPGRRRLLPALRYAAVVAAAFGAGFGTRTVLMAGGAPGPGDPDGTGSVVHAPAPPRAPAPAEDAHRLIAESWLAEPGRPSLARSLVALSHATRDKGAGARDGG